MDGLAEQHSVPTVRRRKQLVESCVAHYQSRVPSPTGLVQDRLTTRKRGGVEWAAHTEKGTNVSLVRGVPYEVTDPNESWHVDTHGRVEALGAAIRDHNEVIGGV